MKNIRLLLIVLLALSMAQVTVAKPKAKHVVLICFDGWTTKSLSETNKIPNIQNLMDRGCYTLHKRSVLPSSSAVNWATMLMGACPAMHGYLQWDSQKPEIPSVVTNQHGIFPTIFSVLKEQHPQAVTGCFYDWIGIKYVIDTLAVDRQSYDPDGEPVPEPNCQKAAQFIKDSKPMLAMVYFGSLDYYGHSKGYDGAEYIQGLERLDKCVGTLVQAVKDAGIFDDTIFMISADHGGINKGHGGKTKEEMLTPFVICGKNVRDGGEFKDVMMQFDVAPTIAYALGLQTPDIWIGKPMKHTFK